MPKKILVVDDEEDILMMIETRLSASGYEIITAMDGIEGLEKARSQKPDLIISDVIMPRMDGFAFYKELKKDDNLSSIPVLILTARGKMEDTFRVMGVDDFITKPFDSYELNTTVKEKLEAEKVDVGISQIKPDKPAAKEEKKKEPEPEPEPESVDDGSPKEGQTKVFFISPSAKIPKPAKKAIKQGGGHCELWESEKDPVKQAEAYMPDVIALDAFVNNKPSTDIIIRVKKSKTLKKKPVIVFGYFDKDEIGDTPVNQRKMEIENAKTACLNAGAADIIGEYDKVLLIEAIAKHIKK